MKRSTIRLVKIVGMTLVCLAAWVGCRKDVPATGAKATQIVAPPQQLHGMLSLPKGLDFTSWSQAVEKVTPGKGPLVQMGLSMQVSSMLGEYVDVTTIDDESPWWVLLWDNGQGAEPSLLLLAKPKTSAETQNKPLELKDKNMVAKPVADFALIGPQSAVDSLASFALQLSKQPLASEPFARFYVDNLWKRYGDTIKQEMAKAQSAPDAPESAAKMMKSVFAFYEGFAEDLETVELRFVPEEDGASLIFDTLARSETDTATLFSVQQPNDFAGIQKLRWPKQGAKPTMLVDGDFSLGGDGPQKKQMVAKLLNMYKDFGFGEKYLQAIEEGMEIMTGQMAGAIMMNIDPAQDIFGGMQYAGSASTSDAAKLIKLMQHGLNTGGDLMKAFGVEHSVHTKQNAYQVDKSPIHVQWSGVSGLPATKGGPEGNQNTQAHYSAGKDEILWAMGWTLGEPASAKYQVDPQLQNLMQSLLQGTDDNSVLAIDGAQTTFAHAKKSQASMALHVNLRRLVKEMPAEVPETFALFLGFSERSARMKVRAFVGDSE